MERNLIEATVLQDWQARAHSASFTIVDSLPEREWARFVERHPHSNIFFTPEMYKVFSQAKGFEPKIWGALDVNGDIQAMFAPVQVSLTDFSLLQVFTTRAISYGSILASAGEVGRNALDVLLSGYLRRTGDGILFTELRNMHNLQDDQPILARNGFLYQEYLNYLIDLTSPGDVFMNIGERTRKNIKNALNKKIVNIEEINTAEQVKECYMLLKKPTGQ